MQRADCFVCSPQATPPVEAPWQWTQARTLCAVHHAACRLLDGTLMSDVLHRLKPDDAPLEGSQLGWILNPIVVTEASGQEVRGWADFVAGGVMIYEDRFDAQDYFSYNALDTKRGVDVLYLFKLIGATNSKIESFKAFVEASLSLHGSTVLPPEGLRRPFDGLTHLIGLWNFRHRLAQLRIRAERVYPESFAELESWIAQCREAGAQLDPPTEAECFRTLAALSARRFSTND